MGVRKGAIRGLQPEVLKQLEARTRTLDEILQPNPEAGHALQITIDMNPELARLSKCVAWELRLEAIPTGFVLVPTAHHA